MSQENVEVVRRALAALNRRDVEAYLEVASPQIELITPALPLQGPITGHEGIRDFFRELWSFSEASDSKSRR
jgi:ketosteroid isomerase-like protein